jgi:hypothetical protein
MKSIHFVAAMLLAGAVTTAQAQEQQGGQNSDTGHVGISGHVSSLCLLGAPSQAAIDLGQLIATSGARAGRIAALGSQQVTLPGSFCNFAGTSLTVTAGALVASDASAVQPGFARAVNYTGSVTNWATSPATATTAATAGGGTPSATAHGGIQPTAKLADLQLTLSSFTVPSDLILVAGGYNGTVTITLGPAAIAD